MPSTRISARQLAPRKLPKQTRSEETVEAVVHAAAQVFERHGYAAGTTNRIAQRAGVSIGSLYQYFPNKDAILVALVRRHIEEGSAALEPHLRRLRSGARLQDVLPQIVEAMVALHARAPRLHRVLFEETPLPRELRAELDRLEDAVVDTAAAALAGELDEPLAQVYLRARVVISSIEGLTHRLVLRPPRKAGAKAVTGEIVTLMRAYLAAPRPPRSDSRSESH